MRKLVVTEFVSLDGVFEAPGPDGSGYTYVGWTIPYGNEEFMKLKMEELRSADMQLLGRITYDGFAKAWPQYTGDEFSDKFNAMPKYVVSQTLKKTEWNNSHIIPEHIKEEIKKLKEGSSAEKEGDILVAGSGKLVRFLLDNQLIDQLTLLVYPVILGTGKKLFAGAEKSQMKLIDQKTFSTGVVALTYTQKR